MNLSASAELATLSLTLTLPAEQLRLRSRRMMIDLSRAIEQHAETTGGDTVLIATFQRLSLFEREMTRYARIAGRVNQIFVLGVMDTKPLALPGVTVIPIEADWPLVQEWVVIARGSNCCVALQSRDAEGFDPKRRSRQFLGRWITNATEVDAMMTTFFQAIEQPLPAFKDVPQVGFKSANAIRQLLANKRTAL
ncbi:MAG: DICT sensory domain-containing protein [Oscillochloridaceae bacterium umkhey_bin13]